MNDMTGILLGDFRQGESDAARQARWRAEAQAEVDRLTPVEAEQASFLLRLMETSGSGGMACEAAAKQLIEMGLRMLWSISADMPRARAMIDAARPKGSI